MRTAQFCLFLALAGTAQADVIVSTGPPDYQIASSSNYRTERQIGFWTADDFTLASPTLITGGSFTGVRPGSFGPTSIVDVAVWFYDVYPTGLGYPVPGSLLASRRSSAGALTYSEVWNERVTAPPAYGGGSRADFVSGPQSTFNFTLAEPVLLGPGQYFFSPRVGISAPALPILEDTGLFFWLSSAWLGEGAPMVLRSDGDIWVSSSRADGAHNASFTLEGTAIPEPASILLLAPALLLLLRRRRGLRRSVFEGRLRTRHLANVLRGADSNRVPL